MTGVRDTEPEGERPEVVFADLSVEAARDGSPAGAAGPVPATSGTAAGAGDVIGTGSGATATGRFRERLTLWLSGHRRLVRVGSAATAVIVLLAAGAAAIGQVSGPELPELVRARAVVPDDTVPVIGWHSEIAGRPAAPLVVGIPAEIVLRGLPTGRKAGAQVLGLAGPALTEPNPSAADVPPGGEPLTANLDTGVDCARVDLPVPAGRYGLRVRVTEAGRSTEGVLPGGDLGAWFARVVTAGCGSWLAKRDLTVTQTSAVVDRTEPTAMLTLTVVNAGDRPATLLGTGGGFGGASLERLGTGADRTPRFTVPARSTVRTTLRLRLSDCSPQADAFTGGEDAGTWTAVHAASIPVTTMESLGLAGFVGTAPRPDDGVFGDGNGPTGIQLSDPARGVLADTSHRICAGWHAPLVVVDGGQLRWDAAHKRLTVPFRVRFPGLRVRSGQLSGNFQGPHVSLDTEIGTPLTVDRSGTVLSGTVAYTFDTTTLCGADNHLDAPGPSVTVSAVTSAGPRSLPFQLAFPGSAFDGVRNRICAPR